MIRVKLLKVYKKKDSAEAANVVNILSGMSQPRLEDDFYSYTQEWTKTITISRGGVFEVSSDVFFLFQQLDIVICELISGVINKNAVMDAVMEDKDVMFQWAISLI